MLATNVVGDSALSAQTAVVGTSYADVRTIPHQPPSAPSRGTATSTAQIQIDIAALAGTDTGGDTILSYHIEFSANSGTTWEELQGYSTNSLGLSVIKTGLVASTTYQVRYRARN